MYYYVCLTGVTAPTRLEIVLKQIAFVSVLRVAELTLSMIKLRELLATTALQRLYGVPSRDCILYNSLDKQSCKRLNDKDTQRFQLAFATLNNRLQKYQHVLERTKHIIIVKLNPRLGGRQLPALHALHIYVYTCIRVYMYVYMYV